MGVKKKVKPKQPPQSEITSPVSIRFVISLHIQGSSHLRDSKPISSDEALTVKSPLPSHPPDSPIRSPHFPVHLTNFQFRKTSWNRPQRRTPPKLQCLLV